MFAATINMPGRAPKAVYRDGATKNRSSERGGAERGSTSPTVTFAL